MRIYINLPHSSLNFYSRIKFFRRFENSWRAERNEIYGSGREEICKVKQSEKRLPSGTERAYLLRIQMSQKQYGNKVMI